MKTPKTLALLPVMTGLLALAGTGLAQAQDEQGRVISSTPVVQQVAVPRQVCSDHTVTEPGRKSGAGALIGGIAGGAMGNAIGNGSGRALATVIGLMGGAIVGDRIEGGSQPHTKTVQQCGTQNFYENRTVAYDVVYEYAGRQYTTRTQSDPGQWIALSVQPAMQGMAPPPPYPPGYGYGYGDGGGYVRPGVVVSTQPGPPAYVTPPVTAVIEYRDAYGYPYRQPRHPYWR